MRRKQITLDDYIDLTSSEIDLSSYSIVPQDSFECQIVDVQGAGKVYRGFILSRSSLGKALTLCDISFHFSDTDGKYQVRPTFRRTNAALRDKKVRRGEVCQRISFQHGKDGYREFWQMIAFLMRFREHIDVGNFYDDFRVVTDHDILKYIDSLKNEGKLNFFTQMIDASGLSGDDIERALKAKKRADIVKRFESMMDDETEVKRYKQENGITKPGEEVAWQHFFYKNKWIFGFGLDYRIMGDFLEQQYVGNPNSINTGNPSIDYLGIDDFTTLVEIKTPRKNFLTKEKASTGRTNVWTLDPEFIGAFNQALGQKEDFVQNIKTNDIIGEDKEPINKNIIRTVDPRVILVYGNKQWELPISDGSIDNTVKRDTLERFTRDSRNVTVLSFDELLRRAKYIIGMDEY